MYFVTEAFECQQSVKEKLDRVLDKKCTALLSVLKAGSYRRSPVSIFSLVEERRDSRYLYRADELAHLLTLVRVPAPVRSFIITGESADEAGQLLTHIYYPARQALALYLYPRRLDVLKRRYDQDRQAFFALPGYLHSVLHRLELHQEVDLLTFLLAAESLTPAEHAAIRAQHSEHFQDTFLAASAH